MSKSCRRLFGSAGLAVLLSVSFAVAQAPQNVTSPDDKLIATANDKVITILDAATQKELIRIQGHTERVTALAFSPDGKMLASGSVDKSVRLWDLATGREVRRLQGANSIEALSFSPDGKTLTAKESDKTTRVWEVATGKVISQTKGP
jgi:WD40 repeat protein